MQYSLPPCRALWWAYRRPACQQRSPLRSRTFWREVEARGCICSQLHGALSCEKKNKKQKKNTSFQLRYFPWQHKLKTKKLRQQSGAELEQGLGSRGPVPSRAHLGRPGEAGVGCAQRCLCCPQEKSRQLSAEQRARPINTGFGPLSYYSRQRALFG